MDKTNNNKFIGWVALVFWGVVLGVILAVWGVAIWGVIELVNWVTSK